MHAECEVAGMEPLQGLPGLARHGPAELTGMRIEQEVEVGFGGGGLWEEMVDWRRCGGGNCYSDMGRGLERCRWRAGKPGEAQAGGKGG